MAVNLDAMEARASDLDARQLGVLLRGEPQSLRDWSGAWQASRLLLYVGVIALGAGCYGAAMGCWRAPLAALFVAIKLPMILLLTAVGNALLNAMLAPLLGLNISLRQSFMAILMSFTIASAILGAFSPLLAFLVWNAPPITPELERSWGTYSFIKLSHVVMIAFAGTAGNLRLLQLLQELSGNRATARRVLLAWLAGNLLLGSQLSWLLRPFIGSPNLPVEFLRATAFQGNFFECVARALVDLFNGN